MVKSFFLSAALFLAPILLIQEVSSPNVHASATAVMSPAPFGKERLAIDLADLLALEDPNPNPTPDSSEATFRKEHFSMTAQLYCAILNTVAHGGYDDLCHLYTDRIATFITRVPDAEGINHYTVIAGQEQTILGILRCFDTTQLDTLCDTPNDTDNIDATVTTDDNSTLLIKLGITYIAPAEEGLAYANQESCAWSEAPRKDGTQADYYWLKTTTSTENSSHDINHELSGELWISLPLVIPAESTTWHTTRDNKTSFHTDIKTTPAPPTASVDRTWSQWWNGYTPVEKTGVIIVGAIATTIAVVYLGPPLLAAALGDAVVGSATGATVTEVTAISQEGTVALTTAENTVGVTSSVIRASRETRKLNNLGRVVVTAVVGGLGWMGYHIYHYFLGH